MIELSKYSGRTTDHLAWCDPRHCGGIEHSSRGYRVNGEVPLILELFQTPQAQGPRLSILERHGSGLVTIAVEQTLALADMLRKMPTP